MLDSLFKERFRSPPVGRLPPFTVVPAKKDRIDLRCVLHRLPQHQIGYTAGCA